MFSVYKRDSGRQHENVVAAKLLQNGIQALGVLMDLPDGIGSAAVVAHGITARGHCFNRCKNRASDKPVRATFEYDKYPRILLGHCDQLYSYVKAQELAIFLNV